MPNHVENIILTGFKNRMQIMTNLTMLYYIATIVNRHSEFRTTINEKGELEVYSEMIPCYTVFHKDTETFSNIWTEYIPNYDAFSDAYEFDLLKYGNNKK